MKWLPRTLFGQITLALFAVLFVVQLASLWLLLDDRGRLNYKLLAEYAAQRMAGIATVLDLASPNERPALISALSVQPTTLSLALPWASDSIDNSADARAFAGEAARQLPHPLDIQLLKIERMDPRLLLGLRPPKSHRDGDDDDHDAYPAKGRFFAQTYVAQIRLNDGSVVTFHHLLPVPATDLPYRLIALLALLGVSTVALSAWVVRRLTRPLAGFSNAASGLARNLNQPALPESGPQEVCQAAQAFNAMQRDLKRLIETRAQALSAVSHDLRLPITRMRLRLEGEIAPELRQKMAHDLSEMDSMIGHTLDFLRAGSNTEAPVALNLDALLDSVIEDMEELGATISRQGRCLRPIKARPHALRRCISNLLDNARVYGGGNIRLVVEDGEKDVRLSIHDDGPGIPASELEKVFEPYFRLESSRARHTGGTGLGLAIAKAIAEAHGGSISLSSEAARGVSATITLPREDMQQKHEAA